MCRILLLSETRVHTCFKWPKVVIEFDGFGPLAGPGWAGLGRAGPGLAKLGVILLEFSKSFFVVPLASFISAT